MKKRKKPVSAKKLAAARANIVKAQAARAAKRAEQKATSGNGQPFPAIHAPARPQHTTPAPVVSVDSDGIVHLHSPQAEVWPYDRSGTIAIKVGNIHLHVWRED